MSIKYGSDEVKELFFGLDSVVMVYIGKTLVWQSDEYRP